ncbi:MAG TPA: hypothetical protein VLX92_21120 [Kofleriaceae bacterium]|nr:hypothetical protein [Kofleriaceae bacterium]
MSRALLMVSVVLGFAGCYTEDSVGVDYGYAAPAPAMVDVSPGVTVVSDYDYPVFYTGGLYWRSFGGVWYSSRWYDRGWAVGYNVPIGIRGIARPEMYAHYRGGYAGGYYRGGPAYRGPAYRPGPAYRAPAYRPAPAYRAPARVAPAHSSRR